MTPKDKKIIKTLVIVLFMCVGGFEGLFFYINSLIKPESYQQQILDGIKSNIGQNVSIKGGIRFALLPYPKLVVSDLIIGSDSYDGKPSTIPVVDIKNLEIKISPDTLLSKEIRLSGIELVNPTLLLQRSNDSIIHWDWLNTKLLKLLNSKNGSLSSLPVVIKGGSINYQDVVNNKKLNITNIDARSVVGSDMVFGGSMQSEGHQFDFVLDNSTSDNTIKESEFPLNLKLSEGQTNFLKVQSIIEPSGEFPKVSGKFNMATNDIEDFLNLISKINNNNEAVASKYPLPVSVNGDWGLDGDVIKMENLEVKGMNSKGAGSATLGWDKWYPTITMDLGFEYIDYLTWRRLLEKRIINRVPKKQDNLDEEEAPSYDFRKENPLPENIEIKLNLKAQHVLLNSVTANAVTAASSAVVTLSNTAGLNSGMLVTGSNIADDTHILKIDSATQVTLDKPASGTNPVLIFTAGELKNTSLNAVLENGAFTVNQCNIDLAGKGVLSIFGVLSQGGTGELRFEGNVEAQGKSLRDAVSMFYSAAKDLPPISMGEFNLKANMYVTAGQIRLFETKGEIGGVNLDGTITIFPEAVLRIDMAIKLQNVNFDYVRDTLRKNKLEAKTVADTESALSFDWLKFLGIRIDAKVIIDGFTFMENKGDKASFSLYAYRGDFRLSDLQMTYPDHTDEFNCNLDVRGKLPFINLMANTDKLDTRYFDISPKAQGDIAPPDTSKKELLQKANLDVAVPLEWMNSFNGIFDLTIRKLIHKNLIIDKIKMQSKLDSKKLAIQKLEFVFSQAQSQVVGTLYGGKVPGINISFVMANADIYEVVFPMTGLDNISGFANLSGNISTSGWSFLEWLQHSDSKILLTARGVKVNGINLPGVTNVIDVARSSADVFNNVNNILTKGTTEFSVDAAFNVKDGELRSPNMSVRAGLVTGYVIGGVKLESMDGQFTSTFRFPNLSSEKVPTLMILLSGNMHKPEIKVDTASLEDFVAKRNVIK